MRCLRFILPLCLLLFSSIPASALAPDREVTRVEVIAPSTPVLDDFTMTYILARRGPAPDPAYRGEVWMWTDGPWIRPYHIVFTAADNGLIHYRMKFSGPALQRIEPYELGPASTISVWSNPILPVAPGARRLLWGALDHCDLPGLDFCLSESGLPPALPGSAAVGLRVTWKQDDDRRLGSVTRPDGAEGEEPRLLAVTRNSVAEAVKKSAGAGNLLPTDGGLIGVWVDAPTPAGIYAALAAGRSYASWGGRILIAPDGKGRALVAGYGPRLTVTLLGGADTTLATDDFHLTAALPSGSFVLTAAENDRTTTGVKSTGSVSESRIDGQCAGRRGEDAGG